MVIVLVRYKFGVFSKNAFGIFCQKQKQTIVDLEKNPKRALTQTCTGL